MEENKTPKTNLTKNHKLDSTLFWKKTTIGLFTIIIFSQFFTVTITPKFNLPGSSQSQVVTDAVTGQVSSIDTAALASAVLPAEGVILPITWSDLGKRIIQDGVIDEQKFRAIFKGGLTNADEQMLTGNSDQPIVLTEKNSRYVLDILWAFGLANKNDILEKGEMNDKEYGGAGNFASTGGWTLARGTGMDHYSKHAYVVLTSEQQALVDKVSKGIFRPCCGNSTHFPDCNHGMAMLGLLELMAKNGVSEQEMYHVALKVNSYWFPTTYLDLATYFEEQGIKWDQVSSQEVLGAEYSSAQGYQQTRQKIQSLPEIQQSGGGCGA